MRTASVSLVGLAIAALGCVELRYPDAAVDRPAPADVRDASDAPDVPVAIDVPVDVRDAADVRDAVDVVDVRDAADVPDVVDVGTDVPRDVPTVFGPTMVGLAFPTASFSQFEYEVFRAVDGSTTSGQGWGIAPTPAGPVGEQSAVFEFATTTPASSNGTRVVLSLVNNVAFYRLASFRLGLTTAGRTTFADGLSTGGNLGPAVAWTTPITVVTAMATNGVTIAPTGTSFLTSLNSTASVYTITLDTPASQLTGLRIDAILNSTIGGPGTGPSPTTGNFILTEVQVSVSSRP